MKRGLFSRSKARRGVPMLNTASLPDLIFTVLFFFMIVTHMRDVQLLVRYDVPQGSQLQKLTHKQSVSYIYIGVPTGSSDSTYTLQLNDKLATIDEVQAFVEQERARMSAEDQARMTVSIKADSHTPLGIVADVKQALQKAGALKINYSARKSPDEPSMQAARGQE